MRITDNDIRSYLAGRWKSKNCPRCNADNWVCGEAENLNGLLPIGSDAATTIAQTRDTLPLVWLICGVCGHAEFIGLKAIEHWKASER